MLRATAENAPSAGRVQDGAHVLAGGRVPAASEQRLILATVAGRGGVGQRRQVFAAADFLESSCASSRIPAIYQPSI